MKPPLLEVWGDTVDGRHMLTSIGLGLGIAGALYLGAEALLPHLVDNDALAHSYALLIGLVGCLVAATVSARLFPPKRDVTVGTTGHAGDRSAAMDEIEWEAGRLGDPRTLSPATQEEVRALGLFDDLLAQHLKGEGREADPAPPEAVR